MIDAHVWMRRQARVYGEWSPELSIISNEATKSKGGGTRRDRKVDRDRRHIGGQG